jgi:hypothetical protein
MPNQTILWTALPNGLDENGGLRLSVSVSPRLMGEGNRLSLDHFPDWLDWPNQIGTMRFAVEFSGGRHVEVVPSTAAPLRADMWQILFRQPPYTDTYPFVRPAGDTSSASDTLPDLIDVHQVLALIGDYPELLRPLGLVVDLVVPAAGIPTKGVVSVTPIWTPKLAETQNIGLRTWYIYTDGQFAAQPMPDSDLADGLLRLEDESRFTVSLTVGAPTEGAAHSSGISVLRRGHAAISAARAERAAALNAAINAGEAGDPLYADDLVRGYRVDVWDGKTWRSLHQRTSVFNFVGTSGAKIRITDEKVSEGFASVAATHTESGLHLPDCLFTWEGWSLSVRRPGQVATEDAPRTLTNTAATAFGLEPTFTVPVGSLPRLRYGATYRLRARVVDLAGNSAFGPESAAYTAETPHVTAPIRFVRHSPVSAPVVMLRNVPEAGESTTQVVVRGSGRTAGENPRSERHFFPAPIAVQEAEWAGQLDSLPPAERYAVITRGQSPDAAGLRQQDGLWIQPNLEPETPYLPDWAADGVIFEGLPGTNGPFVAKFGGQWPNLQSFRLRLVGTAAADVPAPEFGERIPGTASALLTVYIPPAGRYAVQYRSQISDAAYEVHGLAGRGVPTPVMDSILPEGESAAVDEATARARIAPARTLTLIHAVQQPLTIPTVSAVTVARTSASSEVLIGGTLHTDAKSTGTVRLIAEWADPVDDPATPYDPAVTTAGAAFAGEIPIPEEADTHAFSNLPFAPGDLKYHEATIRPVGVTRFRAFFPADAPADIFTRPTPDEIKAAKAGDAVSSAAYTVKIPNAARPAAPDVAYLMPSYRWEPESVQGGEGGAVTITRTRRGNALRVYLKRPWFSSGAGELLGVVFRPLGFAEMSEAARAMLTVWAQDPTREAAAPPAMTSPEGHFVTDHIRSALALSEMPDGLPVSVAGYPVDYDSALGLWYADVELALGEAYQPFVRLALARYQPESVVGAHLSQVVTTEYTQLPPDRTVTLSISGDRAVYGISLTGVSYTPAKSDLARRVEVRLERRREDMTGDLAWEKASFVTAPLINNAEEYSATLTLAEGYAEGKFRLVIVEYETYYTYGGADHPGDHPEGRPVFAYTREV